VGALVLLDFVGVGVGVATALGSFGVLPGLVLMFGALSPMFGMTVVDPGIVSPSGLPASPTSPAANSIEAAPGQPSGGVPPLLAERSAQFQRSLIESGAGGNSTTGVPANAPFMKAVHMAAGNEPPVTVFRPPVPDIEMGNPSISLAMSTAVESSGV
jgi:hypothetical protein